MMDEIVLKALCKRVKEELKKLYYIDVRTEEKITTVCAAKYPIDIKIGLLQSLSNTINMIAVDFSTHPGHEPIDFHSAEDGRWQRRSIILDDNVEVGDPKFDPQDIIKIIIRKAQSILK
jgi:hypothetical protein